MDNIVSIEEGQIRGIKRTNLNDEEFHAFLCIPYGKAPVGDLRFKAPQPVEAWKDVRNATEENNFSFQLDLFTQQLIGQEDCLSLHVFTKKLPKEEANAKPVMVYIHGGGFIMGNHQTKLLGPEFLMTEDIVLVSITYRPGIFGFLSLKDSSLDIHGNAGLKDQVLALKWVQRNIRHFNGDPNNVTIFGESAGAASVEYLLLSPLAKNLFHKAIMQSGSTLNHWARAKFDLADFAEYLGKPTAREKEILKMLTEMPVERLYSIQTQYLKFKKIIGSFGLIGPVIEKTHPGAFITKNPIEIIQSGNYNKVPVITGYNNAEGIIFEFIKLETKNEKFEIPIKDLLPYETDLKNIAMVWQMCAKIQDFYCGYDPNVKVNLASDSYFISGIITSAKNQAKYSNHPVYLYRFTLDAGLNLFKRMGKFDKFIGACHADELGYLFKNSNPTEMGELERSAIDRMVALWTNFAKYGNPTPKESKLKVEWKPITDDQLYFLNIGKELKLCVNPEAARMKFWNEIFRMNPLTAMY